MLDPRRLLLLVDVVRAGSITSAATRLNYTTSAVSQQISKLETEVGQPLLERHARGVRLTEAGAVLVRRAERIETQLLAAGTELDDIAGLRSGTVRIGTFPTAGASLLPPVVKVSTPVIRRSGSPCAARASPSCGPCSTLARSKCRCYGITRGTP